MPIIKSIGRKDTNFRQLIDYLHRQDGGEKESLTYLHNINGITSNDTQGIEQAFTKNNQHRRKWKNGIGQYHEVMSFHPDDTAILKKHPDILEDLAQVYLELRAPDSLGIARVHTDKDHVHLHFMISPNEIGKNKSIRISKKLFQALRRTIEDYQLVYYPELRNSYVQSRDKQQNKEQQEQQTSQEQSARRTHKKKQMEKRGTGLSDKKDIASTVKAFLASTDDLETFDKALQENDAGVYYYKGRLQGVVYNGRKYRFSRFLEKGSAQMQQIDVWNEKRKELQRKQQKEQEQGLEL